ncbi:hypothetical protein L6R52_09555 [Myxococcota bacterium]|nr:hypothetical protein [Myxococcota bacterium]
MKRWVSALVPLALAASACAVFPTIHGKPPRAEAWDSKIDLLVRGFRTPQQPIDEVYGYYVYLLFAAPDEQSRPHRLAAGRAFLRLFEGTERAEALGVPPERLAILLAPVVDGMVARELEKSRDAQRFLEGYDYLQAQLFLDRLALGAARPAVSLVGYPRPIEGGVELDPKELWVIDLSDATDQSAEDTMLALQDALKRGRHELDDPELALVRIARSFFSKVGRALLDIRALLGTR